MQSVIMTYWSSAEGALAIPSVSSNHPEHSNEQIACAALIIKHRLTIDNMDVAIRT